MTMARERYEFNYEGSHYKSTTDCVRLTGHPISKIIKERTGLKRVKMKNNVIIAQTTKKYEAPTLTAKQRGIKRRAVEAHLDKKRDDSFENWMVDFV